MTTTSLHIISGVRELNVLEVSPRWVLEGREGDLIQVAFLDRPSDEMNNQRYLIGISSEWLVGRQVVLVLEGEWSDMQIPICKGWVSGYSLEQVIPIGPHYSLPSVRHWMRC